MTFLSFIVIERLDIGSIGNNFLALPQIGGILKQCFQIPIIDDDIVEPDETFKVILERLPDITAPNVKITTTEVTVKIIDNDRGNSMAKVTTISSLLHYAFRTPRVH